MGGNQLGLYVAVDGVDGVGKTSFIPALKKRLEKRGLSVLLTREPGATEFGSAIREILKGDLNFPKESEVALFMADRINHNVNLVVPALTEYDVVISDRSALSTLTYQKGAFNSPNILAALVYTSFLVEKTPLIPNLHVMLKCDPTLLEIRLKQRIPVDDIARFDLIDSKLIEERQFYMAEKAWPFVADAIKVASPSLKFQKKSVKKDLTLLLNNNEVQKKVNLAVVTEQIIELKERKV